MLDCSTVDEDAFGLTEAGVDPLRAERGSLSLWRGSLAADALEKAKRMSLDLYPFGPWAVVQQPLFFLSY